MSFDWLTFLNVASELLKQDGEEYVRTSINRSYYAVFNKTRQIIKTEEKKIIQPPNVHRQVIDFFKKNNDNLYRQIGNDLDRLRRERVKADYRDDITIKRGTALKVYTWAEKLKTDLAAIC